MSAEEKKEIAKSFLTSLSAGEIPESSLTNSATMWTLSSGAIPRQIYLGGLQTLLSLFQNGIDYDFKSLTAEGDTVVVEACGSGLLKNGENYVNDYVFIFRLRDNKIDHIAEYFNISVIAEKILPFFGDQAN